jgi:hypothetical protein
MGITVSTSITSISSISAVQAIVAKCIILKTLSEPKFREILIFLDKQIDGDTNSARNNSKKSSDEKNAAMCKAIAGPLLDLFVASLTPGGITKLLAEKGKEILLSKLNEITGQVDLESLFGKYSNIIDGFSVSFDQGFNKLKAQVNLAGSAQIGLSVGMGTEALKNAVNGINPASLKAGIVSELGKSQISNMISASKNNIMQSQSKLLQSMSFLKRGGIPMGALKAAIVQGICDAAFKDGFNSFAKDAIMKGIMNEVKDLEEDALTMLTDMLISNIPGAESLALLSNASVLYDSIKADIMSLSLAEKIELRAELSLML